MLYVIEASDGFYESSHVSNVVEVESETLIEQYRAFIVGKAKEIGLTINPHWLNLMHYDIQEEPMTKTEYNRKCKQWKKMKKDLTIIKFAVENLGGKVLEFKSIYL